MFAMIITRAYPSVQKTGGFTGGFLTRFLSGFIGLRQKAIIAQKAVNPSNDAACSV